MEGQVSIINNYALHFFNSFQESQSTSQTVMNLASQHSGKVGKDYHLHFTDEEPETW